MGGTRCVHGRRRRIRRRGFTLIELLVIIAILSILIALLIPSLKTAKDQAKLALCLMQVRGMGQGLHFYSSDHDGALPTDVYYPPGLGEQGDRFFEQLASYVTGQGERDLRGSGIFDCPMHLPYRFTDGAEPVPGTSGCSVSYGYNGRLMATWNLPSKPSYTAMFRSLVMQPSSTIAIADHGDWDNTYIITNSHPYSSWGISDRHFGGSCMVFVDGHGQHHLPDEIGTNDSGDNWFHPSE